VRVTTALCATRRHESNGDERAPTSGCRSSPDEAGGSLTPEARARAGAAATKARRASTTRWPSACSARRKGVTEVNQWLNPLKRDTGSNLVDGRGAARTARVVGGNSEAGVMLPVARPRGRSAAYSWRCCKGKSWAPTPSIETW
jgi:hypothetical protein